MIPRWKRSLSLVLVFLMLVSCLPLNVLAADTGDDPADPPGVEEPAAPPTGEDDPVADPQGEEDPEDDLPGEDPAPETDPAVANVQAMINALPWALPVAEGETEAAYEARLAALEQQLLAVHGAAAALSEEQLQQLTEEDIAKLEAATAIPGDYRLSKVPAPIAAGTEADPHVLTLAAGAAGTDGATLYKWITDTVGWVTYKDFYAVPIEGGAAITFTNKTGSDRTGYHVSGNTSVSVPLGTYEIKKFDRSGSFLSYKYAEQSAGYITIAAAAADATFELNAEKTVLVNGHYGPDDEGLAQRIYNAVVKSTNHDGAWTVTVYDGGTLSVWRELDSVLLTTSNFAPGQTKQIRITWAASAYFPAKTIEVSDVKLVESREEPTLSISQTDFSANTQADFEAAVKAAITSVEGASLTVTFPEGYTFPGEVTVTARVSNSGATWIAGGETEFTVTGVVKTYAITWNANEGFFPDGYTLKTTFVDYGETPTPPADEPVRTGTTFAGWGDIKPVDGHTTYDAVWANDKNGNEVDDKDETTEVQVSITGNGTVALSGSEKTVITPNDDGIYTVIFDSLAADGRVINVTATPNDTVNTDGSVDYLVSATETVTLSVGETATVDAVFGTVALAEKETIGSVPFNKYTWNNNVSYVKGDVLTAVLEGGSNADEYKVEMKLPLLGWKDVTENGTLDAIKNAVATALKGDNVEVRITKQAKDGAPAVSKEYKLNVEDSRPLPVVSASQNEISFEAKEEVSGIVDAVQALFTIKTGENDVVAVNSNWVKWSEAYAWPADAETKTYTVTVQVPDSETYQKSNEASVTVTVTDTTILYSVTYLNGYTTAGNAVYERAVPENSLTPKPEKDPTREYYTFTGWDPEVDETVTNDVEYTALWKAELDNNGNDTADQEEKYTVVYDFNGGTDAQGKTKAEFSDLAWGAGTPKPEKDPTRDGGYNFNGWGVDIPETVSAPAEGNTITYTARWTLNHVVTFIDRESVSSVAVEDGKSVAEPEPPVWDEDHDFVCWTLDDFMYDFELPVTGNLTLVAWWIDDFNHNNRPDENEDHFTVTYIVDGVETRFENVLVDTATPTVDAPAKDGWKFIGWGVDIPETVTADAVYTAQWVKDANGNDVDDAEETITITVSKAMDSDKVTVTGAVLLDETTGAYLYDSTGDKAVTIKAEPSTTGGILTEKISASYVQEISENGAAAALTYAGDYSVSFGFTAENGKEIAVVFADAGFVYNDERLLNFYPGMEGVVLDDVYNTIVDTPDLPGEYTLQYFARPASSHTVNLSSLGLPDTIMSVLKLLGQESITIDMPDLWLDVEVNDLSQEIENAVSLDQACAQYLTYDRIVALWDIFQDNGGLLGGGVSAVTAELKTISTNITNAAMYDGAHSFGHNATGEETKTEQIKVTYKNAERYIEGQTDITLKDLRAPSYMNGSNVSVMYRDYTDEDLFALIAPSVVNAEGAEVEGALVSCTDITDPYTFEDKSASETGYELKFKFAGNETYKPCEAAFTVTVTKAPAKFDAPDLTITYGEAYDMLAASHFTLGNQYGDPAEVAESMIQFVLGLDVADLDVDADGVKGLDGKIQLILPDELQSILDGILGLTGGNTSDGMEMSLADLTKYLEAIPDGSLGALSQALKAIANITEAANLTITLGGALPKDIGAYLYGAVSTSSNYETAFDVAYLIITPDARQVYLDWNYSDSNGVFTYELLHLVNMGASAYDDEAFSVLNTVATAAVHNVIFGLVPALDEEGDPTVELKTALYAPDTDPEDIEKDLSLGAYTQLAFVGNFGNTMHYALPIVRAFVLMPNPMQVEIGDEADVNTVTFNGEAQELDVALSYEGDAFTVDPQYLTVSYAGIQTNTKAYEPSTTAPTHAGAYVVTAIYVQKDEQGNVIAVGGDVEPLIIKPAASTISVTGGKFDYDGQPHGVSVESSHADVTILSGYVSAEPESEGLSIGDITGVVNVDAPKWLDDLLAEHFPNAYANGVTKADLQRELQERTEALLAAGVTQEMINSATNLLKNIPTDVQISFNGTAAYTEPGVYAFLGVVTDSDYIPSSDTGLVVIGKKPLTLDMVDTTVNYNGKGQFIDVVSEPVVTDFVTIIIDRNNNIGNILLDDDMTALLTAIEEALGYELPSEIDVTGIQTALNAALTKLERSPIVPCDLKATLQQIHDALKTLPQTGVVYINGEWLPTDIGTYEFYGASYSAVYQTNLTQGVLKIMPVKVTITAHSTMKVYGETDPAWDYTITGLDNEDAAEVLNLSITRAPGEDVGVYPIKVTAENPNCLIRINDDDAALTIVPAALTITVNSLTKSYGDADPAWDYEITGLVNGDTEESISFSISRESGEDVGSYPITATAESGNYLITVDDDGAVLTITKATAVITVDTTPIEVTYGETVVLPEATSSFGTVSCDKTPADLVKAGTYTVTYTVEGTDNYDGATVTVTVTVKPADISIDEAPAANADLSYTGEAQQLVSPGAVTGGTVEFSTDGENWSTEIPTATDAGDYTVYYRVNGDENHNDTEGVEITVSIAKADSTIDEAPAAIENLKSSSVPQELVTVGSATGGTMEYSLDGENWSTEIPTATDAGDYTVYYRVKGDTNHNDAEGGSVQVTVVPAEKQIQFPAGGPVQPGDTVEIDGTLYTVDEDGTITVPASMTTDLIVTSYGFSANAGADAPANDPYAEAHKAYPLHMYVWSVEYDAASDSYKTAEEITELRDFFTYAGTSIRYSKDPSVLSGIRIITSVNKADRAALINGTLIGHEALNGWKLVEYGTLFKNITNEALADGAALVYNPDKTGNASVAYNSQLDQIFQELDDGTIRYTGMLVDLADELLDDELVMRPYMILESPTGERITIHGGSLQRNVGYVAWQNRDFNGSAEAIAYIQAIITKVYG